MRTTYESETEIEEEYSEIEVAHISEDTSSSKNETGITCLTF